MNNTSQWLSWDKDGIKLIVYDDITGMAKIKTKYTDESFNCIIKQTLKRDGDLLIQIERVGKWSI